MEMFFRALNSDSHTVPKAELKMLKTQILLKDCTPKELEYRKKLYKVLEKTLIYLGIFEKHLLVLAGSDESLAGQIKGLKVCLDSDSLLSSDKKFSQDLEKEFLKRRKIDFVITFRKEPSKIAA